MADVAETAAAVLTDSPTAAADRLHADGINAPVRDFLAGFRGRRVKFFPNPGNAGDALIAAATYQLFARLGIPAEPIGLRDDAAGEIVVLGGGGNLVPLYHDIRDALLRFKDRARLLVLLPHTIRGHADLLRTLGANCVVFCRDRPSLDHVRSSCDLDQVHLAHDMAFNLSTAALLADGRVAAPARRAFAGTLARCGLDLARDVAGKTACFFREDAERLVGARPSLADIADRLAVGVLPVQAERASWHLLELLRHPRRIVTDRLHVAIAGALLGREVHLFDNSYGKNAAVFAHSLRPLRRQVAFHPAAAGGDLTAAIRALADPAPPAPAPPAPAPSAPAPPGG